MIGRKFAGLTVTNDFALSGNIWRKEFWKAVFERAIKTFAQAVAGSIIANAVGIFDQAWLPILSVALVQFVLSVLTSITSDAFTKGGPSLVSEIVIARRAHPDPLVEDDIIIDKSEVTKEDTEDGN